MRVVTDVSSSAADKRTEYNVEVFVPDQCILDCWRAFPGQSELRGSSIKLCMQRGNGARHALGMDTHAYRVLPTKKII